MLTSDQEVDFRPTVHAFGFPSSFVEMFPGSGKLRTIYCFTRCLRSEGAECICWHIGACACPLVRRNDMVCTNGRQIYRCIIGLSNYTLLIADLREEVSQ